MTQTAELALMVDSGGVVQRVELRSGVLTIDVSDIFQSAHTNRDELSEWALLEPHRLPWLKREDVYLRLREDVKTVIRMNEGGK